MMVGLHKFDNVVSLYTNYRQRNVDQDYQQDELKSVIIAKLLISLIDAAVPNHRVSIFNSFISLSLSAL